MILIRNTKSAWTLFNIYLHFLLKLYITTTVKASVENAYKKLAYPASIQLKLADFNFALFVLLYEPHIKNVLGTIWHTFVI